MNNFIRGTTHERHCLFVNKQTGNWSHWNHRHWTHHTLGACIKYQNYCVLLTEQEVNAARNTTADKKVNNANTHEQLDTHSRTTRLNRRAIDDQSLSPLSLPTWLCLAPDIQIWSYLKCTPSPSVGTSERLTNWNGRAKRRKEKNETKRNEREEDRKSSVGSASDEYRQPKLNKIFTILFTYHVRIGEQIVRSKEKEHTTPPEDLLCVHNQIK